MYYVELHERAWGIEMYPKRPSLEQIMTSAIVAFWYPTKPQKDERYTVTLHDDLADIHRYVSRLLLRSRIKQPDSRLARLFIKKQQVKIKGIRLLLEGTGVKE